MKKIIKIILVIAFVISTVFVMGRYGWKLTGFKLCQNSMIYDVQVDENRVTIKGRDANFIPRGFVGYYYEIEDNCLYIGFRFSSIFGFFEKSEFQIEINSDEKINKIIMKSAESETVIYDILEKQQSLSQ